MAAKHGTARGLQPSAADSLAQEPNEATPDPRARSALARALHRDTDTDASDPSCILNLPWGYEHDKAPDGAVWQKLLGIYGEKEDALYSTIWSLRLLRAATQIFHVWVRVQCGSDSDLRRRRPCI